MSILLLHKIYSMAQNVLSGLFQIWETNTRERQKPTPQKQHNYDWTPCTISTGTEENPHSLMTGGQDRGMKTWDSTCKPPSPNSYITRGEG